ncbi:tetratricopeptide repeat protein [Candidatus Omnitrophota bacterium]
MNNTITKNIKILIVLLVFVGGVMFARHLEKGKELKKVLPVGLTESQNEYFQKQLKETGVQYGYIKRGYYLLRQGKVESSIEIFKIASKNAYSQGTKAEAYRGLADAYEKKKDYKKALEYIVIIRDEHVNDWAKAPVIERAKYLEYASKGNYEMAVKYAEKALEVETNMPYNKGVPSQGYIERLNDLKASKDYMESPKK